MKKLQGISFVLILMMLGFSGLVFAGEGTSGDYLSGAGIQIGRGVWNVVSSPAEIPCTMRDDMKKDGGIGAATGFGKGLVYFVRRVIVGVSEIATFVMPSEGTLPTVCTAPVTAAQPGVSS